MASRNESGGPASPRVPRFDIEAERAGFPPVITVSERLDAWYAQHAGVAYAHFPPLHHDNHPEHRGSPVKVGPYKIFAGGTRDLRPTDFEKVDMIIPLEPHLILDPGQRIEVLWFPWRDGSSPPPGFREFLKKVVIPLLDEGKRIMVYCMGSHGRTGTFIAALIALLESREETPDPIAAVRKRHCERSVERLGQARAIFALRGEKLPDKYDEEFYFHCKGKRHFVKRGKGSK